jgi:hypothetical protein
VPSDVEPERLADLLEDARAIPAAAFSRSKRARKVLDLSRIPRQRTSIRVPDSTVSWVEAAESELAGYRR